MRQLVVPACVCLMTLTGTSVSDSTLSLGPAESRAGKEVVAAAQPDDARDAPPSYRQTPAEPDPGIAVSVIAPIDSPEVNIADDYHPGIDGLIPLPPVPKPVMHRSHQEICETLTQAAQSNDLPVPFFIRLLFQESRFEAGVVSHAGAEGIAQFMRETSASVGLDNPYDPLQAIPASARLLRDLFQQFGNLGLAAAAYNAGPKRIQDWLAKKGKLPDETQGYVKTITGSAAETWTAAVGVAHAAMKLPRRAPCQEAVGLYAWDGPDQIPLPPTRAPVQVATAKHAPAQVVKAQRLTASAFKVAAVPATELTVAKAEPAKNERAKPNKVAAKDPPKIAAQPAVEKSAKAKNDKSKQASLELAARPRKVANAPLPLHRYP